MQKHKNTIITVMAPAVLLFSLLSSACDADKLNVLTSTSDLSCLVEAIGGSHVSASALADGRQDPHFIQAKPSYMIKAKRADLWIRVGLELEIGYETLIIDGSRNRNIRLGNPGHLDVSEGILALEVPTTQKIDRSLGDVHPLGNPHYWLDPYNGRIMARNIAVRLKQLDPAHASDYDDNLARFADRLDRAVFGDSLVDAVGGERLWALQLAGRLDEFVGHDDSKAAASADKKLTLGGWLARLGPYRGCKVVTYHRSWSYFTHRLGLVVAAELEPKPGIPPSPAHLAEVIAVMKDQGIRVILMEPFYARKAADFVGTRTGAEVIMVANSVGGEPAADGYLSMLDNIVEKVAGALGRTNK